MTLSDRVALVTGASQGIGRVCALKLAQSGAAVALAARGQGKSGISARSPAKCPAWRTSQTIARCAAGCSKVRSAVVNRAPIRPQAARCRCDRTAVPRSLPGRYVRTRAVRSWPFSSAKRTEVPPRLHSRTTRGHGKAGSIFSRCSSAAVGRSVTAGSSAEFAIFNTYSRPSAALSLKFSSRSPVSRATRVSKP